MGCGCSSGSSIQMNSPVNPSDYSRNVRQREITDCNITSQILTTWKATLTCVKNSGKLQKINLSEHAANRLLGVLQSALNYPDNYCYYILQLDYFRDKVLNLIIENVPECID